MRASPSVLSGIGVDELFIVSRVDCNTMQRMTNMSCCTLTLLLEVFSCNVSPGFHNAILSRPVSTLTYNPEIALVLQTYISDKTQY